MTSSHQHQRWKKFLLLRLSLPLMYVLFILSSPIDGGFFDWFGSSSSSVTNTQQPQPQQQQQQQNGDDDDAYTLFVSSSSSSPLFQKQIPCGLLFAKQSEQVHPLPTVLIDSTMETSTMTQKTIQEHGLSELVSAGGVWIPAGSLWLRIDEATVPAPAMKVIADDDSDGGETFSLKLGMDFLKENRAKLEEEDELYVRVNEGEGDYVLIPYIVPRGRGLNLDNTIEAAATDPFEKSGDETKTGGSQLVMRKQVPCGLILSSSSAGDFPEVHPLKTVIDSTVASSTISRKAVNEMGLSERVQSNHDNQIIPPESFMLRMDEATVPSPLLRVVEDTHDDDSEVALMLGMFFLRENEARMKDGDLYLVQVDEEEVLVPFIEPRVGSSGANDEL